MQLSSELVSQFVKATKDSEPKKKETTVYGTVYVDNGTKYVKIDGSDLLTPVLSTVEIQHGERVAVLLKNHTATVTGNISSPSVRNEDVNISLEGYATTVQLETEKKRIDELEKNKLDSSVASETYATKETANELSEQITKLQEDKLDSNVASETYATKETTNALNERIDNLVVAITQEEYEAGTWTAPEGAIIIILDPAE